MHQYPEQNPEPTGKNSACLPYGGLCRVFKQATLIVIIALGFQAALSPARASGKTIITVLGDSLSAGYGLARKQAFPAQLQQALTAQGFNVTIRNAGVSGDTAEDGLARLDWAVAADVQGVIVELGANDALRGHQPQRMRQALEQILTRLNARKITILLTGMKAPRNMGPDYTAAFDRIYPELTAKYNVILMPFFLKGVATRPELNLADGLHPTAEGVARIVRNALPYVVKMLRQAGAETGQ